MTGRRRAFRISLLLMGFAVTCSSPAQAYWSERPNGRVVAMFATLPDRALVRSIQLPDSAAVGKRYGREVLGVATVRAEASRPKAWAIDFARKLFDPRRMDDTCSCNPVRATGDTSEIVAPVVELRIGDEALWVFLSFPDRCALVYLEQGTWGAFRMRDHQKLLAALRAALPSEPVFASDSLLRQRPTPRNHHAYVSIDQLPEAIERVPPDYPAAARAKGISGTVLVQARINVSGHVTEARVAWSVPELDAYAVDTVKRWGFKPAMTGGRPVEVWVMIPVRYYLTN